MGLIFFEADALLVDLCGCLNPDAAVMPDLLGDAGHIGPVSRITEDKAIFIAVFLPSGTPTYLMCVFSQNIMSLPYEALI